MAKIANKKNADSCHLPNSLNIAIKELAKAVIKYTYDETNKADSSSMQSTLDSKPQEVVESVQIRLMQEFLNAEMDAHIGMQKNEHQSKANNLKDADSQPRNYRNGGYQRRLRTSQGDIEITMPRDRDGTFNSKIAPKGQRNLTNIADKILYLAAEGNSCRAIALQFQKLLGIDVSHEYIATIIESYQKRLSQWMQRDIAEYYPFIFINCLYAPIRLEDETVEQRAIYAVLGINNDGYKELITLHVGNGSESKSEWLNVFKNLQSRGLKNISFISMDGGSGLEEGIQSLFPEVKVQRCFVHLMRNSLNHVDYKDSKNFASAAKQIYLASDINKAKDALQDLKDNWLQYPKAVTTWEKQFDNHIAPLFQYPEPVRKVIYTTNPVEPLNSSIRKVIKQGTYNSKESIMAMILLRVDKCLANKWSQKTINNWSKIKAFLDEESHKKIVKNRSHKESSKKKTL